MIEVETYLPGKDNNRKDDQVFCSLTVLLDIPLVNPGEAQEPPGEGPKETKVGTWSETKENNMVGTLSLCITSSSAYLKKCSQHSRSFCQTMRHFSSSLL